MIRPRPITARRRLPFGLATGAAAIVTAAVLATTGSAQTQPTTLHLLTQSQNNVGFSPKHPARPGDQLGFGERVTGDDTGFSRIVCTVVGGNGGLPCTIWIHLAKGTLTAQGLLPEKAPSTQVAITGGTGAYNGARGTAFATNISQTKSRLTINVLP